MGKNNESFKKSDWAEYQKLKDEVSGQSPKGGK